jgi:hypothetical protein
MITVGGGGAAAGGDAPRPDVVKRVWRVRPSLPVVEQIPVEVGAVEQQRIAALAGDDLDSARVHWVDANGRWGGVSIALTAANRLAGDWPRRPFVIVQRSRLRMPPRSLPAVLEEIGPAAFRPSDGRTGAVVLAPCRLIEGTGMNLMVLAAEADAEAVKATLLGTLGEDVVSAVA